MAAGTETASMTIIATRSAVEYLKYFRPPFSANFTALTMYGM